MAEILVVDDERTLREGIKKLLTGEGHSVRTARDGGEALSKIDERRPDIVLLDVMMPKMNGFKCCEAIRLCDALLPIVFLTAKDSEADQVRGLGLGADDYVSKAADETLLLARVSRALERASLVAERLEATSDAVMWVGRVCVDMRKLTVSENGKEISRLTRTEADLLRILVTHRGEMFVKDDLITELRGNGFACEDAMLYTHISNLRRKLGSASAKIVNTHGVGYGLLA